jgi:hypothetical protein
MDVDQNFLRRWVRFGRFTDSQRLSTVEAFAKHRAQWNLRDLASQAIIAELIKRRILSESAVPSEVLKINSGFEWADGTYSYSRISPQNRNFLTVHFDATRIH